MTFDRAARRAAAASGARSASASGSMQTARVRAWPVCTQAQLGAIGALAQEFGVEADARLRARARAASSASAADVVMMGCNGVRR